ncbi:MAG: VOC family protein [Gammaproteobacteria bacterium]|nr:VOC family protein [Gammaproteobacteria bacterium]
MSERPIFHLSVPVSDLERARTFYCDTLGCQLGRVGDVRLDVDFFGHHVVMHLDPAEAQKVSGEMDSEGDPAPIRHFGVIVDESTWQTLVPRLEAADVDITYGPKTIRAGTVAEQRIVMMRDGCGNVVELKAMPAQNVFKT